MNKFKLGLVCLAIFVFFASPVQALIWVNWGYLLEELLIDRGYSHGCFHVSPVAMKILYETLARGTKVTVKSYRETPGSGLVKTLPDLLLCVNSKETLKQAREAFAQKNSLRLEVFPDPGIFIFYYDGKPYAKLRFRPGFEKRGYLYFGRQNGLPAYDQYLLTPTIAGTYATFLYTNYLFAWRYPVTTAIPYGAKISRQGSSYYYEKNNQKFLLSQEISEDLLLPKKERNYCFFDETIDWSGHITSAKWGSHDYGIYVIGLSPDMRIINQDLIYAAGTAINDQRNIAGNLAKLVVRGTADLDESVETTGAFAEEKTFYDFLQVSSNYSEETMLAPEIKLYLIYFKMFNRLFVSPEEKKLTNPIYEASQIYVLFGEKSLREKEIQALASVSACSQKAGHWIFNAERIQGIYYSFLEIAQYVADGSSRYEKLAEFWPILLQFKDDLLATNPRFLDEEKIKNIIYSHLELTNQ